MEILVALEADATDASIVNTASQLASAFKAKLWLLHVAAPEPDFVGYDAGPQSVRNKLSEHMHDEHKKIQLIAGNLRTKGLDVAALMIQGGYAEAILEQAVKLKVDYIVVGAHKHSLLSKILLGSVSESVVRGAKVPVLVVPVADQ